MLLNAGHLCTIQKRHHKQKLTYTGSTGTPVVGQTVIGATSTKTAVIHSVASGYIVVEDLSGSFAIGETIRIGASPYTFTGTLAAQEDYRRSSGEYEFYWATDQSNVRCRIYQSGGGRGAIILMPGATVDLPLKIALPSEINVTPMTVSEYRITTTETGWSGTYSIERLDSRGGMSVRVDHFEATVRKVP